MFIICKSEGRQPLVHFAFRDISTQDLVRTTISLFDKFQKHCIWKCETIFRIRVIVIQYAVEEQDISFFRFQQTGVDNENIM